MANDARTRISATVVGNALEWYEILVYGYFSLQISRAFFPAGNETLALLLTFGVFSLSYISRPLGAMVLGAYADRVGRVASLRLSIALMMASTAVIVFMPPFEAVGWIAPLGVVAARLAQGFSAGGEYGSSTALLIETSSAQRSGLAGSWQFASQGVSTLLASSAGLILSWLLTPDQLQAWGWRAAFALGLLIGPVGYYLRRSLADLVPASPSRERAVWREVIAEERWTMLLAIGALAVSTAVTYMIVFLPTYAVRELGATQALGFACALTAAAVQIIFTPLGGVVADRFGGVKVMRVAAAVLVFSFVPAFLSLSHPAAAIPLMLVAVAWLAFWKAIYIAPYSGLIALSFPRHHRATGLALSYNVGVAMFGGSAPVIMTWLGDLTGSKLAPAMYLTAVGVLSLASVVALARNRPSGPD